MGSWSQSTLTGPPPPVLDPVWTSTMPGELNNCRCPPPPPFPSSYSTSPHALTIPHNTNNPIHITHPSIRRCRPYPVHPAHPALSILARTQPATPNDTPVVLSHPGLFPPHNRHSKHVRLHPTRVLVRPLPVDRLQMVPRVHHHPQEVSTQRHPLRVPGRGALRYVLTSVGCPTPRLNPPLTTLDLQASASPKSTRHGST